MNLAEAEDLTYAHPEVEDRVAKLESDLVRLRREFYDNFMNLRRLAGYEDANGELQPPDEIASVLKAMQEEGITDTPEFAKLSERMNFSQAKYATEQQLDTIKNSIDVTRAELKKLRPDA